MSASHAPRNWTIHGADDQEPVLLTRESLQGILKQTLNASVKATIVTQVRLAARPFV